MAYMKSLTVSGQTYQVKDPEAVDFSKVQNLTPAQQAQARENIGATTETHIVDKLCASFTESGSVVTCEPVEGYPLEVTAEEGATTITRCGKNLVPNIYKYGEQTINGVTFTPNEDGSITVNGTATANATYRFSSKGLKWNVKPGVSYTLSFRKASGSFSGKPTFAANYYLASGGGSLSWLSTSIDTQTSFSTKPCPEDLDSVLGYITVPSGVTCTDCVVTCQVELGVIATAYEPYREPETFAVGEPITANPGVNTIFADAGLVTVKGKADPVAIINKLTNAILSLGGNV